MAYNHTLQQKYKPHFQLHKNLVLRQHKLLNKSRHYGNERLQDSDVLPNPRTGYILDWKITEPQNMSRNIHDFVDLKKKKIALGNNILYSGSSRKGRYNSTGRVSSQKASRKTDAGLSPWWGRDFSPSQLPVQTLIQCLHSLRVQLHALTSVCGLKLPNTSSHTGHTASTDNTSPTFYPGHTTNTDTSPTFTLATPQALTTPVQPSPWPHHKHWHQSNLHPGHTTSTDNTSPTFTLATLQTLTTPVQPSPWPHHKHWQHQSNCHPVNIDNTSPTFTLATPTTPVWPATLQLGSTKNTDTSPTFTLATLQTLTTPV